MAYHENSTPLTDDQRLVRKARFENKWILNSKAGKWYTPEEFEDFVESLKGWGPTPPNHFIHYLCADPFSEIESLQKGIIKNAEELKRFTDKVTEYFTLQAKERYQHK